MQNDVFEKIRLQDLSWTDLGPIWAPKRVQDGSLLGPKLGQRSLKISSWEVLRPGGLRPEGLKVVRSEKASSCKVLGGGGGDSRDLTWGRR